MEDGITEAHVVNQPVEWLSCGNTELTWRKQKNMSIIFNISFLNVDKTFTYSTMHRKYDAFPFYIIDNGIWF